jgi:conjugative transfer region protein TrbK
MTISAKTWARTGAVAFIAFAVLVSALSLRTERQAPGTLSIPPAYDAAAADPLVAELYHCQALGQAGASDPDCLRAWAENRRRFLAPGAIPEARLSPTPPMDPSQAPASAAATPADGAVQSETSVPAQGIRP